MLQVQNLSKQFSAQVLFENISFNLQAGERVGLVGRNGSGKSTLFKLILGELSPDSGEIILPKNYQVASLKQYIEFTQNTVLSECTQVLAQDEKYDFYKAEKILTGLGFSSSDMQKDPLSFSGGYQIRINLCKSLLTNPNLLLLDEPTNYLDIVSLRWLRQFLLSFSGEVIIITHDRAFMDSVTTHTMGIYRKGLKKIKGSTNKFYEQLEQEDEIYLKTKTNLDKKRAHLESFVERFSAKASKATQAQSKLKQLAKIDQLDDLAFEASMGLRFNFKKCPGKTLLSCHNLAFGYKPDQLLFSGLNFSIGHNDRIGIIGKNGKGKSTLLNVLANELKPIEGQIDTHASTLCALMGQTNVNRLNNNATIIDEVASANPELPTTKVRQICGSLLFTGDLANKKISVLSGGERNRVMLGKILATETNLLFLDEPTNHLDMESIEILTEELLTYEGAIVLVTHSEDLLRKVATKLIVFRDDGAELFDGSYDDFLAKIGWEDEEVKPVVLSESKLSKKEIHAKRQLIIKERSRVCGPLKKQMETLEANIMQAEVELAKLHEQLEQATEIANNDQILALSQQVGLLEEAIQNHFEELETVEQKHQENNRVYQHQLDQLD